MIAAAKGENKMAAAADRFALARVSGGRLGFGLGLAAARAQLRLQAISACGKGYGPHGWTRRLARRGGRRWRRRGYR